MNTVIKKISEIEDAASSVMESANEKNREDNKGQSRCSK